MSDKYDLRWYLRHGQTLDGHYLVLRALTGNEVPKSGNVAEAIRAIRGLSPSSSGIHIYKDMSIIPNIKLMDDVTDLRKSQTNLQIFQMGTSGYTAISVPHFIMDGLPLTNGAPLHPWGESGTKVIRVTIKGEADRASELYALFVSTNDDEYNTMLQQLSNICQKHTCISYNHATIANGVLSYR